MLYALSLVAVDSFPFDTGTVLDVASESDRRDMAYVGMR